MGLISSTVMGGGWVGLEGGGTNIGVGYSSTKVVTVIVGVLLPPIWCVHVETIYASSMKTNPSYS
jgi:hypothetical protein